MPELYPANLPDGYPVVYDTEIPGRYERVAFNLALPSYLLEVHLDIERLEPDRNPIGMAAALGEAVTYLSVMLPRNADCRTPAGADDPEPPEGLLRRAAMSRQLGMDSYYLLMQRYGDAASEAYRAEPDPYNNPTLHFFRATANAWCQAHLTLFHALRCEQAGIATALGEGHRLCARSAWYAVNARLGELHHPPGRRIRGSPATNRDRHCNCHRLADQAITALESVTATKGQQ